MVPTLVIAVRPFFHETWVAELRRAEVDGIAVRTRKKCRAQH